MAPTETKKTEAVSQSGTDATDAADLQQPKASPPQLSDVTDIIDQATFEQILEMDDDDDSDFSKGIVYGFFDQAENTFKKMETALKDEKLDDLSSLGHFLKGSSATLGLTKVKDSCEKIQHLGAGKDESGSSDEPDKKVSLKNIDTTLKEVKVEYAEVEKFLRRWYGEEVKPKEKEEEKEKEPEKKKEEKSSPEQPKAKEEPAKEKK